MAGLPATGELTYNGYTFDGASHVQVDIEFVYDESDRIVIAHKHTISVQAIVQDDAGVGDSVLSLRKRLGEAGKAFTFKGRGFGDDLKVNTNTGGNRDIDSGPKPRVLTWEPIGNNLACDISWKIVVTTTVCKGIPKRRGVKSLSYGITYDINARGETTRTIQGNLTIAGLGVGKDTADRFRTALKAPPIPDGFKRTQSWAVSPDRAKLEFTITDEQIGSNNPYYPGMVEMSAQHRISWRRGGKDGAAVYRNTMSAVIHPSANLSASQAWLVFQTMAVRRLRQARDATGGILIDVLEIEEDLFTRSQSFRISWRVLSKLEKFIDFNAAGIFTPLGTKWDVWTTSLANTAFDQRGSAKLRDAAVNDVRFGLCEPTEAVVVGNEFDSSKNQGPRLPPKLKQEKPKKEQSWLKYRNDIMPYRDCPVSRLPLIQDPKSSGSDEGAWELDNGEPPSRPADYGSPPPNTKDDVFQEAGLPRYSIRIMGEAERAGHHIPRTVVLQAGKFATNEIRSAFKERVVGDFLGVPVYHAVWYADYMIGGTPGLVFPPNSISERVDAKTNQTLT